MESREIGSWDPTTATSLTISKVIVDGMCDKQRRFGLDEGQKSEGIRKEN